VLGDVLGVLDVRVPGHRHLRIGGTDPAERTWQVRAESPTHMKDVDLGLARQVQSGRALTPRRSVTACTARSAAGMSMSLRLSGTCASRATAVGASSSKTPSSPRNPLTEELRGEGPVADVHTSAEYLLSVISSSG
jgi:inosose dehydratase